MKAASHVKPHEEPAHVAAPNVPSSAMATAGAVQAIPHRPQFLGSVERDAQVPMHGVLPAVQVKQAVLLALHPPGQASVARVMHRPALHVLGPRAPSESQLALPQFPVG